MNKRLLTATVVLIVLAYAVAFGAQRRIGDIDKTVRVKQPFEANSVKLPSMPNTSVTFVPEASGAIVVWFDPPVVSVTGEWFTERGTFTCCTPDNQCVDVDELGGPDAWYGGVGLGWFGNGLVDKCRFSGGADFNVFSVME